MDEFQINDKVKVNWKNVIKNLQGCELKGEVLQWVDKDDIYLITRTENPCDKDFKYQLNQKFWFTENEIVKSE